MAEPDFDAQFTFDDLLRTELGPASVDFLETGFFRSREAWPNRPSLPTTAHVRDRVGGETAGTVSFPELGLFVKFGPPHRVRLEEAQALQAIRRAFPSDEVRSPELVGWRKEGDVSYIYMSLIPGPTLEACWPTLTFAERTNVTDQLAQMLASLRGVRQDRGIEYIGEEHASAEEQKIRRLRVSRRTRPWTHSSKILRSAVCGPIPRRERVQRCGATLGFA